MNINRMIRATEVRLIGPEGEQVGIMPLTEALARAAEAALDLVEVAPQANPPVCRIMDYGKFKYLQSKKVQEARKKQTIIQVKEVKFRPKIEEHDVAFKIKNIRRFLAQKDKTKISLIFRGREIAHPQIGIDLLNRVATELEDIGTVEQPPKIEGRNLTMIIAPK
nr:translation initiation factor IF-3 [Desulfobacca acetoxidans]